MKKAETILLFTLCAIVFMSCSQAPDVQNNETTVTGAQTAAETEQTIFDLLPERDFAGENFTVYIPPNPDSPVDKGTYAAEVNGETFNDAVYNRNLKIEQKYNTAFKFIIGDSWNTTYEFMKKAVMAGESAADVYFTHVIANVSTIISDALVTEWTHVPHIDFEQPWWNRSVIQNLNIANKKFYAAGSASIQDPLVLLFNKTMLESYNLADPYELVRSGAWTFEKLSELAEAAAADLNGDGEFTKDDQFGLEYGIHWQIPALMYACDEVTIKLDENGYPTVNIDSEKMFGIFDKIYSLLFTGDKTYCYDGNITETANIPHIGIASGRVLFCQWNLFSCEKLRDCEVEYGILPLPKYDEAQGKYVTNSWTGMYCIPVTATEEQLDKTGIVMESMSATGYSDVVPVYYDNVLSNKVSRDQDSCDMLDIILSGLVYDMGLNFNVGSSAGSFMGEVLYSPKKDYASSVAKQVDKIAKSYDKYYQTVTEKYTG